MKHILYLWLISLTILTSCTKNTPVLSSDKKFLSFGFNSSDNPGLVTDVAGAVNGSDITVAVPSGCDITSLIATFSVSPKAAVTIGNARQTDKKTRNNFSTPLTYTVVAEDGSSANYTVTVTRVLATDKDIITFFFEKSKNPALTEDISCAIDLINKKISCSVPVGTSRASFIASYTVSKGATLKIGSVVQSSGVSQNNFENPVVYTVYAEDGGSCEYLVTVTRILSSEKEMRQFVFEKTRNTELPYDLICEIDTINHKITCQFPSNIPRNKLVATFVSSDYTSVKVNGILQVSGQTSNNFENNVTYDVVAEDNSTLSYFFEPQAEQLPVINTTRIKDKIKALNYQRRTDFQNRNPFPGIEVVPILSTTWNEIKPAGAFSFDCGYIAGDGKIYVSAPVLPEQKALFPDVTVASLFYVCKAFLKHYYKNSEMPLWFINGFAAYEAGVIPGDAAIKSAINSFGGTLPSFTDLNNRTNFTTKNGVAIAYLFGEFLSVFYCWPYWDILETTGDGIVLAPWRFGSFSDFEQKWTRYVNYRIFKDGETRLKWQKESENFRYLYRDADALNFPLFTDTLETAYSGYKEKLGVSFPEKITIMTLPEGESAYINGEPNPGRITGGTAWPSGLALSCATTTADLPRFPSLLRHELAHEFQSLIIKPGISLPAWLNEGFPGFMQMGGMLTPDQKAAWQADANKSMNDAIAYFGHKPTYQDLFVYPSPYFNYYLLGEIMYEFIYSKGGYMAVKSVTEDPVAGFATIGYATPEAFLSAYYTYFDDNWKQ